MAKYNRYLVDKLHDPIKHAGEAIKAMASDEPDRELRMKYHICEVDRLLTKLIIADLARERESDGKRK